MADTDCVAFLRWALPRLGKRWAGYRRVRRQVCRRARRRAAELGLSGLGDYRGHLERHSEEWEVLDGCTCITISRFYRDRGVFAFLEAQALPALADRARDRGANGLMAWSAGCASGEEAYTLSIMWQFALAPQFPGLELRVLATDVEPTMLARARRACFAPGSLRDLPHAWRRSAFAARERELCVLRRFRRAVTIERHDIRTGVPGGRFDIVLCRNLAFTYFDEQRQRDVLQRLAGAMRPGAALVVGSHEHLPPAAPAFRPWSEADGVYRRLRTS